MKTLIFSYLHFFLHPFKAQEALAIEREGEFDPKDNPWLIRPSLLDFLGLSWALACVKGLYGLLAMIMGLKSWNWPGINQGLASKFLGPQFFNANKVLIFYILLEVVLFPLSAFVFIKFWGLLIRFFIKLYDMEFASEQKAIDSVLAASLTSNVFFLVPVMGDVARHLSSIIYLFAGLRQNLKMSILQSLIVVISPLFILFFALLVMGLYVAVLLTAL